MISKQLEYILAELAGKTPGEMTQRFQRTRDCGLLPKSRGEHAEPLSNEQIAAAILCLVPERPGYAGLQGKALANLRPVGGTDASFRGANTLGAAIAAAIEDPADFIELEVLDGDFGTNAYGYGAIRHTNTHEVAHYVRESALTLMQRGAERGFDPRLRNVDRQIHRKIVFSAEVFSMISRKVVDARQHREQLAKLQLHVSQAG